MTAGKLKLRRTLVLLGSDYEAEVEGKVDGVCISWAPRRATVADGFDEVAQQRLAQYFASARFQLYNAERKEQAEANKAALGGTRRVRRPLKGLR
jgi:hypothetical protein